MKNLKKFQNLNNKDKNQNQLQKCIPIEMSKKSPLKKNILDQKKVVK